MAAKPTSERTRRATMPSAWMDVEIASWQEFLHRHSAAQPALTDSQLIYRGQSNIEWDLEPTLIRGIPASTTTERLLKLEEALAYQFRRGARFHLDPGVRPDDDPLSGWWPIMRHYGAPTRLLDWSRSIFVAAYFACASSQKQDGAIFICHQPTVLAGARQRFPDSPLSGSVDLELHGKSMSESEGRTFILEAAIGFDRMVAQQGLFVCSSFVRDRLSVALARDSEAASQGAGQPRQLARIVIPHTLKAEFLFRLREMNITAVNLFPGPDGVGQDLSDLLSLSNTAFSDTRTAGNQEL